MERKLAAILSADVQGYSRLMGDDEEATIRTLTAYREVMTSQIEGHRGRVVDAPGDNLLAEFPSAVHAVESAVAIQRELADRNAELPEKRRMAFRIGIHVGDVVVDDERLFGDGVNIAARVEGLADGGGICISEAVHMQVENKLPLVHEDLGEQTVKNIARPVRAYRVRLDDDSLAPARREPAPPPLPDKPSIAVLPFDNMSGDPDQAYFSDGITEDIITDLSKVSGLFVIARNSSFTYKGTAVDVAEVSRKLGARYVLEGSVRRAGNRVRINAQLIDGMSGGHLWAERYDGTVEDVFALQDEVTRQIVDALQVTLSPEERERVESIATQDTQAYECWLRARELVQRHTRQDNEEARPLLERAVTLDPHFALAYAMMAYSHTTDYINGWSASPEESLRNALHCAQKAVALGPQESQAHAVLGMVCVWAKQLDRAQVHAERAIELDPNSAFGYGMRALASHYAGHSARTLEDVAFSMRLDPAFPDMGLYVMAQAHFMLGEYQRAIEALRRRLIRSPRSDITHVLLAAALGHLGRADEAREAWRNALACNPDYSLERRRTVLPYRNPEDFDRIVEGLRKAGLP